ncbi:MAG: hypothetical protein M1816_001867 [Peltula sp. TS41687]|nr:MAG: hypothetical protein M1816_001867 [Peltula sp. TS41687]
MSAMSGPPHIPGDFPAAATDAPSSFSRSQRSLWAAVHARKSEYTVPRRIRIKVGSWNVAALKDTEKDLGRWFVGGKDEVAERRSLAGFHVEKLHGKEDSARVPAGSSDGGDHQQESTGNDRSKTITTPGAEETSSSSSSSSSDETTTTTGRIYVLGLQEVVDISSATEALRPYTDPGPAQRWKRALLAALPAGYEVVAEQQLMGLLVLVAADASVAGGISSVSTTSVGTGLFGYMGNKGAVAVRMVLGASTKLVFVNCHLAAGSEKTSLERRNWDAAQILLRTRFEPIQAELGMPEGAAEGIGDEDCAWWFGDLNYRLEGLPGDDVRRLLMLHTRGEYGAGRRLEERVKSGGGAEDVGHIELRDEEVGPDLSLDTAATNSSGTVGNGDSTNSTTAEQDADITSDPVSLNTTISSLLTHDQLYKQQAARKAFHDGWREGPINFLPTYKYDVGSVDVFDSSDKKRGPSWCDRILFRTQEDKQDSERRVKEEGERRKSGEGSKVDGSKNASKEEDEEGLIFEYDPETDGADDMNDHNNSALSGQKPFTRQKSDDDKLRLEAYTSHQGTVSSDHKPLVGLFTISYDAAVPELKEKIYREVAREFDKAENEERPGVTIVVEHAHDESHSEPEPEDVSQEPADVESIMFGRVRYREEKIRTCTVANTGRVLASFTFTPESPDKTAKGAGLPTWLSLQHDGIESEHGERTQNTGVDDPITIQPGDAVNFTLRLRVDTIDLVRALNEGTKKLEHVLVLSVQGGRDYFIPTKGIWMLSCFGRSLEELNRIPAGGVRALQQQQQGSEAHLRNKAESRGSAPRELFRLTEAIESLVERTVAGWGMTEPAAEQGSIQAPWELHTGWPFDKDSSWSGQGGDNRRLPVHEALDTDQPACSLFAASLPAHERLCITAEVLLDFLAGLRDGIVTAAMWAEIDEKVKKTPPATTTTAAAEEEQRFCIFEILSSSPVHNVSFVFLISMLARVIAEITSSCKHGKEMDREPSSPSETPSAAVGGKVTVVRKHLVDAYAAIFAEVLFRGALPAREKERRAAMQRRRLVVELFLKGRLEAE